MGFDHIFALFAQETENQKTPLVLIKLKPDVSVGFGDNIFA